MPQTEFYLDFAFLHLTESKYCKEASRVGISCKKDFFLAFWQ